MQRRLNIFGGLIDTADMPEMMSNVMSAGRLVGFDFMVAESDFMSITAGSCLLPDGVLIIEDEVKNLIIPNSSLETEYTVMYQLEDTRTLGGSPAILRLVSGMLRQDAVVDGTILGWIRYPGGSVPLSDSFFIQPSHLRITNQPDTFYYNQCPISPIRTPASEWPETIEYILNEPCTRYTNTSAGQLLHTLQFPFIIPSKGQPRKLVTRLSVDFNCLVSFSIKLNGMTVALTPNSGLVSNTGTLITREFDILLESDLVWSAGNTAYIEAVIDAQANRGASIAYVGLTLEPTPFTLFT